MCKYVTNVFVYVYAWLHTCVCIFICVCVCIYICIHTHIPVYVCMCVYVHTDVLRGGCRHPSEVGAVEEAVSRRGLRRGPRAGA